VSNNQIEITDFTMSEGPPVYYGSDEEEHEMVSHFSNIIDFKKIKAIKFDDPIIEEKLKFTPWHDFYKFENAEEAAFEADFGLAFILYKFQQKHDTIPKYLTIRNEVISGKFFDKFYNKLNIPAESMDFNHMFDNKTMELGHFYISMEKMIFYFDGHTSFLVYPPEYLKDKESPLWVLLGIIKQNKLPRIVRNKIYVVYRTQHGFQKKPFDVKKRKIDLGDNYSEDFPKVSEDIITKLNNKNKTGLVILHGEPGTGKTTYIRYLAGRLKRDIIFISPDMVTHITSPEFIPFLMENSDSILIIEDAEPALQKRQGDARSGAVSNILNMTDGLLSDCLNISIVATFNTTTSEIDEALRRQGRLLREYKFDKLDLKNAQELMDKLGHDVKVKEPMSLAEIYFYGDVITDDNSGNSRKKVGFQ
jgi:hypothetical protein